MDEGQYAEDGELSDLLDPATAPLPPELDPTADELGEDEYDEYGEEDGEAAPSNRRRVILLAGGAFALGLAAVVAVIFLPNFVGNDPVVAPPAGSGGATHVATGTNPGATTTDPSTTDPIADPVVEGEVGPEASDPLPAQPDVL